MYINNVLYTFCLKWWLNKWLTRIFLFFCQRAAWIENVLSPAWNSLCFKMFLFLELINNHFHFRKTICATRLPVASPRISFFQFWNGVQLAAIIEALRFQQSWRLELRIIDRQTTERGTHPVHLLLVSHCECNYVWDQPRVWHFSKSIAT